MLMHASPTCCSIPLLPAESGPDPCPLTHPSISMHTQGRGVGGCCSSPGFSHPIHLDSQGPCPTLPPTPPQPPRVKQGPTFRPDRAGLAFLPIHSGPHSVSFLYLPSKLNSCLCRQQLACSCVAAVDKFRLVFCLCISPPRCVTLPVASASNPLTGAPAAPSLPAHPACQWPQA